MSQKGAAVAGGKSQDVSSEGKSWPTLTLKQCNADEFPKMLTPATSKPLLQEFQSTKSLHCPLIKRMTSISMLILELIQLMSPGTENLCVDESMPLPMSGHTHTNTHRDKQMQKQGRKAISISDLCIPWKQKLNQLWLKAIQTMSRTRTENGIKW